MSEPADAGPVLVSRNDFPALFDALRAASYRLIGPTRRDQAIVYDRIESVDDLPIGWGDEQGPGAYRLKARDDRALFGFNLGPDSWKKFLHQPVITLWHAERGEQGMRFSVPENGAPKQAFIGIRSCELHAIAIQDRVLAGQGCVDPHYAARRKNIFTVAVQCMQAASSCFCTSMGTGPEVDSGYDLKVSELIDSEGHRFLFQAGSEEAAAIRDSDLGDPKARN